MGSATAMWLNNQTKREGGKRQRKVSREQEVRLWQGKRGRGRKKKERKKVLKKIETSAAGLEPTREFPSRFLVYRLNHSATRTLILLEFFIIQRTLI